MCIPNEIKGWSFPGNVCPDDNMQHFTIGFWSDASNTVPILGDKAVTDKAFEANVHFNYTAEGHVISIDVCLIAPMPDIDPNEPVPYEVTDIGRDALKLLRKYPLLDKYKDKK
jgi:hypothetical protein